MNKMLVPLAVVAACLAPGRAAGQTFETLGVRAAGMAGAFVGVADDATAVYWNPAGLASGALFSLALDWNGASTDPARPRAGSRSSTMFALSVPALGLSYYRLRATRLAPAEPDAPDRNSLVPEPVRVESLITHHIGGTLVQSLTDTLAAGATVKLVRGLASSLVVPDGHRPELLAEAGDLVGAATSRVDLDLGLMVDLRTFKAGLAARNVLAPSFASAGGGDRLSLERAVRAGVSFAPVPGWLVAGDVDLTRNVSAAGEVRDVAVGTEGRLARRLQVRGGFRWNTLGGEDPGRRAVFSVGGSYAVFPSVLLDLQVTPGGGAADRGWGLAGRIVF